MLKVVGIWDDGWATGVRISERADDYDPKARSQRDSGVSNGSGRREPSPTPIGEIKAFPVGTAVHPSYAIEADSDSSLFVSACLNTGRRPSRATARQILDLVALLPLTSAASRIF